jgi:predicted RND superfamily exporter protein
MDYNTAADSLFEEFQNIELPPDVTLNLTGTYQVLRQISETVRTDFFKISLLSLIAVCVLILIFFRNVLILFMSVLPVIAAILFTFATMVLFGVSFTPARIGIAALLIGIGIDDAVHILVRIRNKSIIDIKYTLMEIGPILVLTTLSTMIGFGALSFSDISVISSLGVLLMVGVIACLLFTILLVPSTYNKFYRKKENKRLM